MRKVIYIDKVFDGCTKFRLIYSKPLNIQHKHIFKKYRYKSCFYWALRIEHKRVKLRIRKGLTITLKEKLSLPAAITVS